MSAPSSSARLQASPAGTAAPIGTTDRAPGRAALAIPFALAGALALFLLLPLVQSQPGLRLAFLIASGVLGLGSAAVYLKKRLRAEASPIQFVSVRSHWVQACVQFSIMMWWAWHWPRVYSELPLIGAQLLYLYGLEGLLTYARGRPWRIGFGPLPIVCSTNLLLWFKPEAYALQFAMLTTGALCKQFLTWERKGRRTHIFNPSAIGQFLFAIGLIATGTTNTLTLGSEIARTFEAPHMLVVIFLGGLVVQGLFQVTLMTMAAAGTLVLFNLIYTQVTGVYHFVNVHLAAPIFLGLHLLITDPATSPKSNLGRVIFGALYGLAYAILFRVLDLLEVPLFWDKLLPVPILNLLVPLIDRAARGSFLGRLNRRWEACLPSAKLNLAHMGIWAALFGSLYATGFVGGDHPGNSIPFWKQAFVAGKPHAGHSLVLATSAQAEGLGIASAYNELGLICMEGRIVRENHGTAARYFATACERGDPNGCRNVGIQYLFLRERRSDEDVARALQHLESAAGLGQDSLAAYLIGCAYEQGRGRPKNPAKAFGFFVRAGLEDLYAAKGMARLALTTRGLPSLLPEALATLRAASARGDGEAAWYLAYLSARGDTGVPDAKAVTTQLTIAARAGLPEAAAALSNGDLPPFRSPIMDVPGWSSAYPVSAGAGVP